MNTRRSVRMRPGGKYFFLLEVHTDMPTPTHRRQQAKAGQSALMLAGREDLLGLVWRKPRKKVILKVTGQECKCRGTSLI